MTALTRSLQDRDNVFRERHGWLGGSRRGDREKNGDQPKRRFRHSKASAVRSPRMMRPFRGVRNTENLALPAAALAVASVLAGGAYLNAGRQLPEHAVAGRPIQVPADGYASSQTCRACHPSQYASWHGSYHRTMTQIATPETVLPSFDGVTVEAMPGEPMILERR